MTTQRYSRATVWRTAAWSALAVGLLSAPAHAQSPAAVLARAVEQAGSAFPGLCAAVVTRDSTTFLRAVGYADVAAQRAYTDSTVQPVGSITKTLIGILLASAATNGTIALDAPVAPLLPFRIGEASGAGGAITWRQLATHTSGLRDRDEGYRAAYVPVASADTSLSRYLQRYLATTGNLYRAEHIVRVRDRQQFSYSNIGAAVAALALEAARGASFATLATREIFGPLDMRHSRFTGAPASSDDAVLYDAMRQVVAPYILVTYPDGGLRTSCADLARLATGVLAAEQGRPNSVMSQAAARLMLSPQFPNSAMPLGVDPREPNQGLFWQFRRTGGIGHSGSDPGVTAFLLIDSKTGTGRLFMTNVDFGEGKTAERYAAAFTAVWGALAQYQATIVSR